VGIIIAMQYEFDESKNRINIEKHGVNFNLMYQFNWYTALIYQDTRIDYGEKRFYAFGYIGNRLYAVVFVDRTKRRIISLRKANKREIRRYINAC